MNGRQNMKIVFFLVKAQWKLPVVLHCLFRIVHLQPSLFWIGSRPCADQCCSFPNIVHKGGASGQIHIQKYCCKFAKIMLMFYFISTNGSINVTCETQLHLLKIAKEMQVGSLRTQNGATLIVIVNTDIDISLWKNVKTRPGRAFRQRSAMAGWDRDELRGEIWLRFCWDRVAWVGWVEIYSEDTPEGDVGVDRGCFHLKE